MEAVNITLRSPYSGKGPQYLLNRKLCGHRAGLDFWRRGKSLASAECLLQMDVTWNAYIISVTRDLGIRLLGRPGSGGNGGSYGVGVWGRVMNTAASGVDSGGGMWCKAC